MTLAFGRMDRFDYLIVGAGFAGAVCAERLAAAGKSVLIVEKRSYIGGNAADAYDEHGILVHLHGPHVFHTNSKEVFDYLSQFTDWRPYEHRVLSSVNGQLLPVPINRTTLDAFGGDEAAARQAMIEPYTKKQWGSYADELSPTVLARIKTRPESRDDRYFTDTYQAMPLCGYTRLFERMLAHPNIKILLKTSYREVCSSVMFPTEQGSPQVIYTGPIDQFFDYRFGKLPYRSAQFVFRTHSAEQFQSAGVVNYPSSDVGFTRVAEFKHLTGQEHAKTTVAFEYPSAEGEPFWPVPTEASAALYRQYQALAAETPGVHFLGRLGTYQYYDIHQVIAQALALAHRLVTQEAACQVQ